MGAISRMTRAVDDRMNPIVVKELRQAVAGRFLMAVLLVFLIVQLFALGVFLLSNEGVGSDMSGGREVFLWVRALMLGTCLLFIPAYAALRFTAERSEANVDLLFITTLPPRAIVWGKFLSAMIVVVLVYSACTPFLSLTYLLRGIDLPTIFLLLGLDLMVVAGCVMLALFLACIPANRALRALLRLLGLGVLLGTFGGMVSMGWGLLQSGLGGLLGTGSFWGGVALMIGESLVSMGLLYLVSVAIISPPSANRALPVRLYLTIVWLLLCGGLIGYTVWSGRGLHSVAWLSTTLPQMIMGVPLLLIVLLVAISERDELGPRVARSIPRNPLLRPFAFLLYSGSAGGTLWTLLMLTITLGAGWLWHQQAASSGSAGSTGSFSPGLSAIEWMLEVMTPLAMYGVAYMLTALLLRRTLLRAAIPASSTYALALVLMALGTIAPFVVALLASQSPWYELDREWFITVPFIVFDFSESHPEAWWFAGIWAGAAVLLCVPWWLASFIRFRPPVTVDREPISTSYAEAPPATAAQDA